MRAVISGIVVMAFLTVGLRAQDPHLADSAKIAAVHALLDLDRQQAWRTDIWTEGEELVLRVTPASPAAEWSRVRPAAGPGPVARVRFDGRGRLDALSVRDTRKPGVRVAKSAAAAARANALANARFGTGKRDDVLGAARERRWTALGAQADVSTAALEWRATDGERERAVWRVRLTTIRDGVAVPFVAVLDPVDGSLLELTKEGTR
jgi:hypothetical protein